MEISNITEHPDYRTRPDDYNDIAILKLKTPIRFSDTMSPVCLPENTSENYGGKRATVIGWGITVPRDYSSTPDALMKVNVPVLYPDDNRCSIFNWTLCAGGEPQKDSCNQDSGGSLFLEENGRLVLYLNTDLYIMYVR